MTNLIDKCNSYIIDNARLSEQLTASQAREKVHIEALKKIALRPWHSQVRAFAEAAIAQPTDDTALKAALAAQRERCVSKGSDLRDAYIENGIPEKELVFCLASITDYQNAIRALEDT